VALATKEGNLTLFLREEQRTFWGRGATAATGDDFAGAARKCPGICGTTGAKVSF